MSPATARRLVVVALLGLTVLHNDLWFWHDGRSLAGLPIGLTYHVAFCFGVSAVMAWAVRHAWPGDLDDSDESTSDR